MNNEIIPEVETHKHLGMHFTNNLTWHNHIEHIRTKAWKRINVMKRLKYTLDRSSLETIYISFIRPILEYGDIIFCNCTNYEKLELDRIQNEAARIVTGATKLVSLVNLDKEIGWESLHTRRKKHKLILFYKMVYGLSPPYLQELIPENVGCISNHNLRNANHFRNIHSKSSSFTNSFLPSVIRDWNSLPLETRNCSSLSIFKRLLNSDSPVIPRHYYYGDRHLQIQHARLRTKCVPLNSFLFCKDLVMIPNCKCGSLENIEHYFLTCPLYSQERHILFTKLSFLSSITVDILIYGDDTLSLATNINIVDAVHGFIKSTKRFSMK